MKSITTVLLMALLVAMGTTLATSAQADADSYLWRLRTYPYIEFIIPLQDEQNMVNLGYSVCDDLAAGQRAPMITYYLWTNENFTFDYYASSQVVRIAEEELCPRAR